MLRFTLCFSLPSKFWCSWVDGDADRYSSLLTTEYVLSNFFLASDATNLNPPSKISFPGTFPYSVHESSKIFLTEYPSGWPCSPNPRNILPHLRSLKRHPRPPSCQEDPDGGGLGYGRREGETPATNNGRLRRKTEERGGKRGRKLGGEAVRLKYEKRDMRGVSRRSMREWLRGGGGRDGKEKDIWSDWYR